MYGLSARVHTKVRLAELGEHLIECCFVRRDMVGGGKLGGKGEHHFTQWDLTLTSFKTV